MSALGFALVLAAACCHSAWNFLVKRVGGGPELVWLFSFASVVIYLPLAAAVWWLESPTFGVREWLFILGSAVLHLGYFLLLQRGYRTSDLSVVYPTARATGPMLASAFAVIVLGEQLTWTIAVGALVIIVGVLCLSGGFTTGLRRALPSMGFGIAAGLFIGSYTVWDAYTVAVLLVPPLLLDYASSLGRSIILLPYALPRRALVARHWREHRSAILLIALFNPLAYILVLYALTFTPIIYVAPLRELSVLITVLLGVFLLEEGQLRERLPWAALVLVGVAILATG